MNTYYITLNEDEYGYKIIAKDDKSMLSALPEGENGFLIKFIFADYTIADGLKYLWEYNNPERKKTPPPPKRWNVRKEKSKEEDLENYGILDMVHISTI